MLRNCLKTGRHRRTRVLACWGSSGQKRKCLGLGQNRCEHQQAPAHSQKLCSEHLAATVCLWNHLGSFCSYLFPCIEGISLRAYLSPLNPLHSVSWIWVISRNICWLKELARAWKLVSYAAEKVAHIYSLGKSSVISGLRPGLRGNMVSESFSGFLCAVEDVMRPLRPWAHCWDLGSAWCFSVNSRWELLRILLFFSQTQVKG